MQRLTSIAIHTLVGFVASSILACTPGDDPGGDPSSSTSTAGTAATTDDPSSTDATSPSTSDADGTASNTAGTTTGDASTGTGASESSSSSTGGGSSVCETYGEFVAACLGTEDPLVVEADCNETLANLTALYGTTCGDAYEALIDCRTTLTCEQFTDGRPDCTREQTAGQRHCMDADTDTDTDTGTGTSTGSTG